MLASVATAFAKGDTVTAANAQPKYVRDTVTWNKATRPRVTERVTRLACCCQLWQPHNLVMFDVELRV